MQLTHNVTRPTGPSPVVPLVSPRVSAVKGTEMAKKRMCKICGENEATCPDRNYQDIGRQTLEVCGVCHGARLRGDVVYIVEAHRKRKEAADRIGR